MTGNLIKALGEILSGLHADYKFEYDEASAMNIKADAVENDKGLIFIEEILSGTYGQAPTSRFFKCKMTPVSIYFCRFSKELGESGGGGETSLSSGNNLTMTRQAIRDRIECEVLLPFMSQLDEYAKSPSSIISVSNYSFSYPTHSRFDSNEVAIVLTFTITQYSSCRGDL